MYTTLFFRNNVTRHESILMKFIIMCVVLSMWTGSTVAQTKIWEKTTEINLSHFTFMQNIPPNNSFIVYGYTGTFPGDGVDWYINFDNQGNSLWHLPMESSRSMSIYQNSLMVTDTGQTIILLDYSGNIIKSIPLPEVITSGYYIFYICQDKSNGEFYMVSTKNNTSYLYDWMVFVYSSELHFLRSFPIMDKQLSWLMGSLVQNGNLYLSRSTYGTGNYSNMITNIYNYDSLGNLVWTKLYPDREDPYLTTDDKGNLYCGATNLWSYINTETWELMKLDPTNGDTVWTRHWLGSMNNSLVCVSGVQELPGGGCIVYGSTNKPGKPSEGWYDPMAIAYSANGDSLFSIMNSESSSWGGFDLGTWDNNHALILSGSIDGVSKIWKYSIPGITAIQHESSEVPDKYLLSQNYPNPWNPSTTINYSLAKEGNVKLTVYNAIGSKVATIVNEYKPAGAYSVKFNGSNLASGIYLYRLESGNYSEAKKFILMK
ncbi:MAG: T9SS type A sorting domain-containing protein [Ignavibacteriaceae bacterium]|nr:T9SS type A sorting domain-containing protein [Ignavibacteriaceae bacterium]